MNKTLILFCLFVSLGAFAQEGPCEIGRFPIKWQKIVTHSTSTFLPAIDSTSEELMVATHVLSGSHQLDIVHQLKIKAKGHLLYENCWMDSK